MYKIIRGRIKKLYETREQFDRYWPIHARSVRWEVDVVGYELTSINPNVWTEITRANGNN